MDIELDEVREICAYTYNSEVSQLNKIRPDSKFIRIPNNRHDWVMFEPPLINYLEVFSAPIMPAYRIQCQLNFKVSGFSDIIGPFNLRMGYSYNTNTVVISFFDREK
jgi:hypothetical protein